MNYSKKFLAAIDNVLLHEGGYNCVREDKGGATKFGISLRFLQQHKINIDDLPVVDWLDVYGLTREQAVEIYHDYFWQDVYERLPHNVAVKMFEMTVNMWAVNSHKILQRALNGFIGTRLVEDGVIGPKTLRAVVRADEKLLLHKVAMEQARFYAELVIKDFERQKDAHPELKDINFQVVFLRGWLNRAFSVDY